MEWYLFEDFVHPSCSVKVRQPLGLEETTLMVYIEGQVQVVSSEDGSL